MNELFLTVLNMSISAGWVALAVFAVRLLFKKAPKWISVMLWGIVALRLVCPVTIESVLSLIPSAQTVPTEVLHGSSPQINSGISVINSAVSSVQSGVLPADGSQGENIFLRVLPVLSIVWLIGIAAMLVYALVSYLKLKNGTKAAQPVKENIFRCENISSPFILGVFKPEIYLPVGLSNDSAENIIAHERAHIARKDHIWKPLGFILLAVYWFNPLMWISYALLCRDIELACDERAVKGYLPEQLADYSQTLLNFGKKGRGVSACPLAFGEVGIKVRVKSVLNYKKPAFWVIAVCVLGSAVLAVCFLTNPKTKLDTQIDPRLSEYLNACVTEHNNGKFAGGAYKYGSFDVLGAEKKQDSTVVYGFAFYSEYDYDFDKKTPVLTSGAENPVVITVKEENGGFATVSYWEPQEGENYTKDIRSKFPKSLQDAVFSEPSEKSEKNRELSDKSAEQYFAGVISDGGKEAAVLRTYTQAPVEDVKALMEKEKTVITKTHYQLSDGTWKAGDDNIYKYRLEVSGKSPSAAKTTTFIILSNIEDISYTRAIMASGLSSSTFDYFTPDTAVIVGMRIFTDSQNP